MSSCVQEIGETSATKSPCTSGWKKSITEPGMSLRFFQGVCLLLVLRVFLFPQHSGGIQRRSEIVEKKGNDYTERPAHSRIHRFDEVIMDKHAPVEAVAIASRIKNETAEQEFDWKSRVHFFVLGAQKAGTTSLYKYMRQHPQIMPSHPKETRCMNHNYIESDPYCATYFATKRFRDIYPNYITGDFSPGYIYAERVIPRVKRSFPNARFIVSLRDPIERAFSQYKMNRRNAKLDSNSTFDSLCISELEVLRKVGLLRHWTFPPEFYRSNSQRLTESRMLEMYMLASVNSTEFAENFASPSMIKSWWKLQANREGKGNLRTGLYALQLRSWMKAFPREQFLVISSNEMSRDTNGVMKRIHAHVGVPHVPLNDTDPTNTAAEHSTENPEISDQMRQILVKLFSPFDEMIATVLEDDKWKDPWTR